MLLSLRNLEMLAYVSVIIFAFSSVTRRGMSLSSEFDVGGPRFGQLRHLRPGWILGRSMDLSDIQWRAFRESFPVLTASMMAFSLLSALARNKAPRHLVDVHLVFSIVFIGFAHQAFSIFPVVFTTLNYCIAQRFKSVTYGHVLIWGYNLAVFFYARACGGFSFGSISPLLSGLDRYSGAQQWHICYNLVLLRGISFGLDLISAAQGSSKSSAESKKTRKGVEPLQMDAYNFKTYLAYIFYPPLYVAGPIMTFQDYASQLSSQKRPRARYVVFYAARLVAALLVLELMTHTLYFNGIAKQRVWRRWPEGFSVFDIGITGYWVLNFMWLKFLVIWRFFRCWALVEGTDPPENMLRCVNNNYDAEGFWRGWHASFNRWLVRYLYIPLGGARRRALNMWVIFTFVALWHDLEWRLLGWAWLTCLAFVPELAAKWAVRQPWAAGLRRSPWFRHLAAAAAAANIVALMAANLLGFVTGADGLPPGLPRRGGCDVLLQRADHVCHPRP
uniref:Membrane-bound o-acyltransferase-like isoform x1 n=2 Tax=Tetraselmis sp. GSL018 TaxID=582737 RepID=A0A061RJP2_9CHLO